MFGTLKYFIQVPMDVLLLHDFVQIRIQSALTLLISVTLMVPRAQGTFWQVMTSLQFVNYSFFKLVSGHERNMHKE